MHTSIIYSLFDELGYWQYHSFFCCAGQFNIC